MEKLIKNQSTPHLHKMVAYGTGLVILGLSIFQLWDSPKLFEAAGLQVFILLFLAPAISIGVYDSKPQLARLSLFVMLALYIILISRIQVGSYFVYSIIWIAVVPNYFRKSACWILLILLVFIWWAVRFFVWQEDNIIVGTMTLATFHVFALLSSNMALQAQQANEKTQVLNRELLATQHLLSEASKFSERTRIAREIHDLLGHHLTALTINLQVAGRITTGEAKDKIEHCFSLSKLLLSDVREAVSTLRGSHGVNLQEILSLAIKDIPKIKISLTVDPLLDLDEVMVADVILRCVQEAITNSLKHSKAKTAVIQVTQSSTSLQLIFYDDGTGVENFKPGNGLRGMRERVERLGGSIIFTTLPSMRIEIELPLQDQAVTL